MYGPDKNGQVSVGYDLASLNAGDTPDCITAQILKNTVLKGIELNSITLGEKAEKKVLTVADNDANKWTLEQDSEGKTPNKVKTFKFTDIESSFDISNYTTATVSFELYSDTACSTALTALDGVGGNTKICLNSTKAGDEVYNWGWGDGFYRQFIKEDQKDIVKFNNSTNVFEVTFVLSDAVLAQNPDCITGLLDGTDIQGIKLKTITFE